MSEPPTFALSPAPSDSAPVHLNFIEKLGGCKGEVCFEYSSAVQIARIARKGKANAWRYSASRPAPGGHEKALEIFPQGCVVTRPARSDTRRDSPPFAGSGACPESSKR